MAEPSSSISIVPGQLRDAVVNANVEEVKRLLPACTTRDQLGDEDLTNNRVTALALSFLGSNQDGSIGSEKFHTITTALWSRCEHVLERQELQRILKTRQGDLCGIPLQYAAFGGDRISFTLARAIYEKTFGTQLRLLENLFNPKLVDSKLLQDVHAMLPLLKPKAKAERPKRKGRSNFRKLTQQLKQQKKEKRQAAEAARLLQLDNSDERPTKRARLAAIDTKNRQRRAAKALAYRAAYAAERATLRQSEDDQPTKGARIDKVDPAFDNSDLNPGQELALALTAIAAEAAERAKLRQSEDGQPTKRARVDNAAGDSGNNNDMSQGRELTNEPTAFSSNDEDAPTPVVCHDDVSEAATANDAVAETRIKVEDCNSSDAQ